MVLWVGTLVIVNGHNRYALGIKVCSRSGLNALQSLTLIAVFKCEREFAECSGIKLQLVESAQRTRPTVYVVDVMQIGIELLNLQIGLIVRFLDINNL